MNGAGGMISKILSSKSSNRPREAMSSSSFFIPAIAVSQEYPDFTILNFRSVLDPEYTFAITVPDSFVQKKNK